MSEQQRSSDDFRMLLDAACEDSLTPEQVQRLESMLRHDAQARQQYEDYLRLHMELFFAARTRRSKLALGVLHEQERPTTPAPSNLLGGAIDFASRSRLFASAAVAALVLIALTVTRLMPLDRQGQPSTAAVGETIAQLTRTVDVVWSNPRSAPTLGDNLAAGQQLELAEGVAEITLKDGAKVSVAGPASLRLNAAMAISLLSGRLTAKVPVDAVGFQVDMPSARVIDKGTAFGINVVEDGDDEIHVFEGQVDAFLGGGSGQVYDKQLLLRAGQAAQFDVGRSSVHLRGANTATFPRSLRQHMENQVEQDNAPIQEYVLSQSWLAGPAPGTFSIEDDEIDLRAGLNNTVCVMLDQPELASEAGQRLEVIAPPLKDKQDGVFLMCSTVAEQPDGVSSFGLRLRRDTRGLWAMSVAEPEWRKVLESEEKRNAVKFTPDPGGPLLLSIERVSGDTFRCYYQMVGSNSDPVLIDEIVAPCLSSYEKLYVGVQSFCHQKMHNYRFSQLSVVPLESGSAAQE